MTSADREAHAGEVRPRFGFDSTAQARNDLSRDRQTQARATVIAQVSALAAPERLEQTRQLIWQHTRPVIFHLDACPALGQSLHTQHDLRPAVAHGVVKQVDDHLAQPQPRGPRQHGLVGRLQRGAAAQPQALQQHGFGRFAQQGHHVQRLLLHIHRQRRLGACQAEQLPDQAGELLLYGGRPGAEISLQDTGIGLGPEHKDLIFEQFYQVGSVALHSSSKTAFKGGGPGLGLAIAKGVARAHGGRLDLRNAAPGLEAIITLPLDFGASA